VKAARENLKQLQEELANQNEPDIEECNSKLTEASNGKTDYAKRQGILDAELKRLKNKAENLEALGTGIEEALNEAEDDYTFAKTLRGDTGTGLQRYVLGIMFSSVIAAANKMLEMVHGGRYHLYRSDDKTKGSNKRGLELKVYDKNSSEHEGRFVGTLSGGEKFLASLALSIGMSTVAQKSGIKIDALFIDEGFGSLDEESIGDAMNILNSIQEAHGMVGIISHVQLLQDRIPTKLKVEETENGSYIVQTIG
jgi:DNA repair exonuclease SbcCD ATPase subunit